MNRLLALILALLVPLGTAPVSLQASTYDWTGGTDANLTGTTNWLSTNFFPNFSLFSITDVLRWNSSSYTNSPTANGNLFVGELLFDAGNTGGVTFGAGTGTITLNGSNLTGTGTGIRLNIGSGAVDTGGANFALSASQSWINYSASTLTVGGTITSSSLNALFTLGGAGNITLNGAISDGGAGMLVLTKSGPGTLTLAGTNTYTGTTTISLGTLKIGNASALGTTAGATTVSSGAVLDLNGFSIAEPLTITGAGINGSGALINNTGTTSTLTGTVASGGIATIGGSGNITINNATGLTGNDRLLKIGAGTLTVANSTTTSTRSAITQIDAGTLRIESSSGSSIAPIGTGAFTLNGGTLSLGFNVNNNSNSGAVNVTASSTIITDRQASGTGVTATLGALSIGGQTLTVQAGSNQVGASGLTMGTVTIGGAAQAPGNPTFDVQSTAAAATTLTLGGLTDQGIAPRTWTFQNGSAFASTVTLGVNASSLVDGTIVNVANTGGAVNLNPTNSTALGTLAQMTVGAGNTLTISTSSWTLGSLAGAGTVAFGGTSTVTIGNTANSAAYNTNFSGVLGTAAAGALTKNSTSTLTLSGASANLYTGLTTVNTGTLILAKTGGATALAGNLTVGSATTGLATVQLSGAGEQIADAAILTIGTNGKLDLNTFSETIGTFAMSGGSIIGSGSTLKLSAAPGNIAIANVNTISANLQLTTSTLALRTITTTAVTDSLTISGNVTEGATVGSIFKGGSGVLTLSGQNTYTGATTVNVGILNIQNSANSQQLGTTALGTSITSGATLQIQDGVTTAAEALTLVGTGFAGSAGINIQTGALVNVSGNNTYAGAITMTTPGATISSDSGTLTLNSGTGIAGTGFALTLAGAGNGVISSPISTGASGTVVKNGAGTWTLTGNSSTYTGVTTVNYGTLVLGNGTSGSLNTGTGLTFTSSGTFEYDGNSATGSIQGMGALTPTSGAGTVKIIAPVTSGTNQLTFASLAATAAGASINFVAPAGAAPNTKVVFTAAPTVVKGVIGAGTLFYNGADFATYSGGAVAAASYSDQAADLVAGLTTPTRITGSFTNSSSLTVDSGIKFDTAQTLTIGNGFLVTISNAAGSAGGLLVTGGVAASILDAGTATGLTTGGAGTLVIRTDTASDSLTIGAKLTSTTTGGIAKTGAGTLTLNGTNAYTGTTFVNAGTLQLGNASAMAATAATVQNGATLDLNGQTITNAVTLNGTGSSAAGALINNTGTASVGAITIGAGFGTGGIGASIGGSNQITSTAALVGNNQLNKVGSGTLIFGTASTRTGVTQIDQGTLRLQAATAINPIGTGAFILNGGTLSLGFGALNTIAAATNVTASSTVVSDNNASGAGFQHVLSSLAIGGQTLTIRAGSNVTTTSTTAGITFAGTTLTGNPTFDVQSPTTATSGVTNLTLGALSDLGVARTITFQNTGTATTASTVTLNANATSLIDGTIVNVNAGTNAGITLNPTNATALGSLAQLTLTNSGSNVATLNLGAALQVASLSGNGNVIGAQTLTIGNATSTVSGLVTFSGNIGFGGVATALTKAGNTTLLLNSANSYTGATSISAGILKIGNASALGTTAGATTVNSGGVLDLAGFSIAENLTLNGAGMNGGGALIDSAGGGTITGTVALGAATTINVGTGTMTINNATGITGGFFLLKTGSGTLTVANSTTTSARSAVTQIDAGMLRIQSSSGSSIAPIGTGAFTLNGGTLSLGFNVNNNSNSGAVNVLASSTIITDRQSSLTGITTTLGALTMGGQTLTVQAGSNQASGTAGLTLGATTIGGATLAPGNPTFDVRGTTTTATTLTLGALSDQQIAPRTWTFQNSGGASTLASTVTLNANANSLVDGTVVNVNAGGNAGITLNPTTATALGSLAQLTLTNNGSNVATLNLGAAVQLASLSGNGNITNSGTNLLTVGNTNSGSVLNTTFSGVIGFGANVGMGLTKDGFGKLTLSGTNLYTGTTTVTNGELNLTGSITSNVTTSNAAIFTQSSTGVISGGAVTFTQNSSGTSTLAGNNNYGGLTTVSAGRLAIGASERISNSSALTVSGTYGGIIGTGTSTLTGTSYTLNGNSGGLVTISAGLGGGGALAKSGNGTVTLSGNNTYSGGTSISLGRLNINSATALGATASTFTITGGQIDNISGGPITLTNNNAQNWNADFTFIGTNSLNLGTGAVAMNASRIVTVNNNNTLTVGGVISGLTFNLTKNGTGTLALGGTNAYTGSTTINAGTLSLTGTVIRNVTTAGSGVLNQTSTGVIAGGASGSLTLGSTSIGATSILAGTNTYSGTTTINGGALEILGGGSALTQSLGALTLAGADVTLRSNKAGSGSVSTTFTSLTGRTAGNTANIVSLGGTPGTDNSIILTGQGAGFIDKGVYFNGADFAAMDATGTFVRALA